MENTVEVMSKRKKNRKSQLYKEDRQGNYVEDENSRRFGASGDIIEDSAFIEDTGSKFNPAKTKNGVVMLDLGEDYDVLDEGSQANYTLQSNLNFKKGDEVKQANRIKLLEWKESS